MIALLLWGGWTWLGRRFRAVVCRSVLFRIAPTLFESGHQETGSSRFFWCTVARSIWLSGLSAYIRCLLFCICVLSWWCYTLMSSYPLLMMVDSILNRTWAFMLLEECAGMIMSCPVSSSVACPSMTTSAVPSITCIRRSKGDIFVASFCPVSKEERLTVPVFFSMMDLMTTESDR